MSAGKPPDAAPKRTASRPCPICGKPVARAFRPFCSARCQDVDLHRWLSGSYAIPAVEDLPPGSDDEPE